MDQKTFERIETDILGRLWRGARLRERLRTLADFPQGRFVGTSGNRAARDYILDQFRASGLARCRAEPFPLLGWERGPAWIEAGGQRLLAIGLPGTPPAAGIETEVVDLGPGGLEEFSAAGSSLAGKLAFASSLPVTGRRDLHRNEKFCRAAGAGAAGFIYARHLPGMLEETGSVGWDRRGSRGAIPAAAVSFESGERLRRFLRASLGAKVRLSIESRFPEIEGAFPIGEVPGRADAEKTIVIGGHFDGHDISQAAIDNGTGIAFVMELADLFAPHTGIFGVHLRFMGFDAEEMGLLGSKAYVERLKESGEIDRIAAVFNLDCPIGGVHDRIGVNGHEELLSALHPVMEREPELVVLETKVSTASDHFPFVAAGVPGVYQYGAGDPREGRGVTHTSADTFDKIDFSRAKPSLATAAAVLARLAATDPFPGRRFTPDEVKGTLAGPVEEALRAQKEWPF